jgi:hypothetical protein
VSGLCKYWLSIVLSAGILSMTMLTCWGLITLYQHWIADMRRKLTDLMREKEALQAQNARIWATFKGLEPHHAEGRILRSAGMGGKCEKVKVSEFGFK